MHRAWAPAGYTSEHVPYLLLGHVPSNSMGVLAQNLKAFSKARQHMLDGSRKNAVHSDMPLWHNSFFKNSESNTYHCPSLIGSWHTRVRHLFSNHLEPNDSILVKLAATWQPVYRTALRSYEQPPISLVFAFYLGYCLGHVCFSQKGSILSPNRNHTRTTGLGNFLDK